jgi:hypothetical protein
VRRKWVQVAEDLLAYEGPWFNPQFCKKKKSKGRIMCRGYLECKSAEEGGL